MSGPALVRVTVASGTRCVDLVLPGAVPVAELVPELARSVGLLDPGTVHGGYRLVTAGGRRLAADAGLVSQGVEDGGLLTMAAGVDDEPPRIYDDVVEAMADAVERELTPWPAAAGRRTALGAAGLSLALGAAALLLQRGSPFAGVAAAVIAAGLAAGAIVLSRVVHERDVAVVVAWTAALYAAVAGVLLGPPAIAASAAAFGAGLICLLGLGDGRVLVLPPVVSGATFLAVGLLREVADVGPAVVLTVALVLVVIAGSAFPWLVLGAAGTSVDLLHADIAAEPRPVDADRVAADARLAHEILAAVSASVGLLLVLIAPFAVSLGGAGAFLVVACCAVVMLRTRRHRAEAEVIVGLGAGLLGLLSAAVAALWLEPDWRPAVAVLLVVSGAVLLPQALVRRTPSVRRGRLADLADLADLAESVGLAVLLPLLVVAAGVLSAIRD